MTSPPSALSDPDSRDTDSTGPTDSQTSSDNSARLASSPPKTGEAFPGLRKALKEDSQSPDSIIRAAAESARSQTGADGVAIALRSRGAVVCRARSGDMAPEIGAQLNAHSGISGECLRTASLLLCSDTETDPRVDPEVCRAMGIRSIVAVPLRGAIGIAGILEAFAARPNAFGDEEIEWLRELASVAETAYEKERLAHEEETMASLGSRRLSGLFTRSAAKEAIEITAVNEAPLTTPGSESVESFPPRKYWVLGVSVVALLMILGVWLSWRGPDLAEGASGAKSQKTIAQPSATPTDAVNPALPSQPKPVRFSNKSDSNLDVVRKASGVERAGNSRANKSGGNEQVSSPVGKAETHPDASGGSNPSSSTPAAGNEIAGNDAPPVTITPEDHSQLTQLTTPEVPMPAMAAPVSQGITQAELIHKVDPMYPLQARTQRISGTVVLEITIGEDGTVFNVKKISGESVLVASAIQAVRQWRYSPVLLNGKAVQAQRQVSVVFKLP